MASELPDLALFPGRLKEAMESARYTQTTLGAALGRDRATVNRWLGGATPDFPTMDRIAEILKCSPRWLAGMTEEADRQSVHGEIARLRQKLADVTAENARLKARQQAAAAALGPVATKRRATSR